MRACVRACGRACVRVGEHACSCVHTCALAYVFTACVHACVYIVYVNKHDLYARLNAPFADYIYRGSNYDLVLSYDLMAATYGNDSI